MPAPDILGDRQSGQDVRTQNGFSLTAIIFPNCISLLKFSESGIFSVFVVFAVVACQAIANIVKSSLGPVGLDKV